ncbi:MAG: site-specific DNA-methyltransferase [Candidatus Omnitrophota bacterium]|jgi:site-specific DNA-methyltransferase (adenine-specific)|nr:MAG: site-specific DNA-methyltransferase [Candidatus Omnitrophota bacterium]
MDKISKTLSRRVTDDKICLYHEGDCVQNAIKYLSNSCIDLLITDPPYGINGHELHKHYNRDESFVIDGYVEIPEEEYEAFSLNWIREAKRVLRPGGSMYIVSGWTHLRHVLNAIEQSDLDVVNHIIWKYNFGVYTRNKYVTSHYHILYLVKSGAPPTFNMFSRFSPSQKTAENRSLLYADVEDVWIIDREYKNGQIRHKNELPKELLIKMIQYSSDEGDVIADFFAGSFSTAKIAKGLNRSSVSFEISQEACDYQVQQVKAIEWGELLDTVRKGEDDRPKNQYQPWSEAEFDQLAIRFGELRNEGLTKRGAIDRLCGDWGRGYFSILNALKKRGL